MGVPLNGVCWERALEVLPATGQGDEGAGKGYFTDGGEEDFLKRPGVEHEQSAGLRRRDGEEEFEVLAIAEGLGGGASCGKRELVDIEGESAAGGGVEAREVFREAVGKIHHGGGLEMGHQPGGLAQAGGEVEVLAGERATELAGDEEEVAGGGGRTQD